MTQNAPVLMVLFPLFGAFVVLLAGLWRKSLSWPLSLAALAGAASSALLTLRQVLAAGTVRYRLGGWAPPWGIEYVVDHLNGFMAVVVSGISFLVAVYSRRSVEQELPDRTVYFYPVFLLLAAGLLGIVVTGDIFNLYVFLEIASLAGYALIAIGEDKRAPLSSLNYVIMGTIGACFYLLGVGYLYMMTGSLNMADLARLLPPLYHSKVVLVAFAFFMVGVAIKIALFPLHAWLPNAYSHAPSAVSAAVASTMTKVGAYVMIRVMFTVFQPTFSTDVVPMTEILGWIAAAAAIFGCVMAIAQTDLKRMLSYILIAEVGYIVLGISAANRQGLTGAVLHIMNDAFMMACLFLAAGAIRYRLRVGSILELGNAHRTLPVTMAAFTVAGISVVGVPPTAGFFSKWYLVLGMLAAKHYVFAVVLLASSLLSAVVFFRIIERVYFGGKAGAAGKGGEVPATMLVPIAVTALGLLTMGFLSGTIVDRVIRHAIPAGW